MDTLEAAQRLIDRINQVSWLIKEEPLTLALKRQCIVASTTLLNDCANTHPTLEKILRDQTHVLLEEVQKEDLAITPVASPEVAAWLEKTLGPATYLNANNVDHYSVVVDLLPLMDVVGGPWKAVSDRVKRHSAAKAAAQTA